MAQTRACVGRRRARPKPLMQPSHPRLESRPTLAGRGAAGRAMQRSNDKYTESYGSFLDLWAPNRIMKQVGDPIEPPTCC